MIYVHVQCAVCIFVASRKVASGAYSRSSYKLHRNKIYCILYRYLHMGQIPPGRNFGQNIALFWKSRAFCVTLTYERQWNIYAFVPTTCTHFKVDTIIYKFVKCAFSYHAALRTNWQKCIELCAPSMTFLHQGEWNRFWNKRELTIGFCGFLPAKLIVQIMCGIHSRQTAIKIIDTKFVWGLPF